MEKIVTRWAESEDGLWHPVGPSLVRPWWECVLCELLFAGPELVPGSEGLLVPPPHVLVCRGPGPTPPFVDAA